MRKCFRSLSLCLGAILLISGALKLQRPIEFLHVVLGYELVSGRLAILFAAMLPWLELTVGCCLLADVMPAAATVVAVALSALFLLASVSAWIRGMHIACGCFGSTEVITGFTVLRSFGMLALSAILWWTVRGDEPQHHPMTVPL